MDQVERLIQRLEADPVEPAQFTLHADLAASCYGRMLELEAVDRLLAIRHAVAGTRLIEALRGAGFPLPEWLNIQEEQFCRFGGMWIHERLVRAGSDQEGLGRQGIDLLRRLDRIHEGQHAWIHHQMVDLQHLLERSGSLATATVHFAIQDHGLGACLPELVRLLRVQAS